MQIVVVIIYRINRLIYRTNVTSNVEGGIVTNSDINSEY